MLNTKVIKHCYGMILVFLMFFGRVGCLTLLYAIVENQMHSLSRMPLEK